MQKRNSLPCIFVFTFLVYISNTPPALHHLLCTYNIQLASFKFTQPAQKGSTPVF